MLLARAGAASWEAPPAVLVPAAVVGLLFAQAFVRLRLRGRADHASWWRAALFAAALAVGLLAFVSPIDPIGEDDLLSVHMVQHVLLGDLAAALGVAALRGPLLFFFLPAPVLGPLARLGGLRRGLSLLTSRRVAGALWAANLAVWHVPSIYDAALTRPLLHDFEHACWLLAGVLAWIVLVDPAGHRRSTVGQRLAFAAAMFAAGTVLSDVLIFSFHSLYPSYGGAYGISPVTDQRLAGVAMMAEQLLTLGTLAAILLRPRIRAARAARLAPA